MQKKIFILVLGLLVSFVSPSTLFAADEDEYSVSSTITVAENYNASVRTIIDIDLADSIPSNISLPAFGLNPQGLEASLADGGVINSSYQNGEIQLLTAQAQQNSTQLSIKLSYTTSLGVQFGQSLLMLLPPSNYGDKSVVSESLSISTDSSLGTPIVRGAEASSSANGVTGLVNTWTDSDSAIMQSVGLLFGDVSLAEATLNKTLENDSLWWKTQTIVLPPDTNQQKVFVDSITPKPNRVSLDEDGNIILSYRLKPRQKIEITASSVIALNSYVYSLDSQLGTNDIDPVLISRYASLNNTWSDTAVSIADPTSLSVSDLTRAIYDEISGQTLGGTFENSFDAASARSNNLVGELRANGIPARLVIGAVFGDGAVVNSTPTSHAWVEAYIPDVGWITLDPTFEQFGDYFGVTDIQRIALAMRGFDAEYPPENLTDFTINYLDQDQPSVPIMKPELKATKYVLFPGVSLKSVSVTMPAGVIVDGAGLIIGGNDPSFLGSLAPHQSVTVRSFDFLANAFTSESVQYGIFPTGTTDGSTIIDQVTTTVSYLPMIILFAGGLVVYSLVKVVIPGIRDRRSSFRKKKRGERSSKPTKRSLVIATDNEGGKIESIDLVPNIDPPIEGRPVSLPVRGDTHAEPQYKKSATELDSSARSQHLPLGQAQNSTPKKVRSEVKRRRPPLIQ